MEAKVGEAVPTAGKQEDVSTSPQDLEDCSSTVRSRSGAASSPHKGDNPTSASAEKRQEIESGEQAPKRASFKTDELDEHYDKLPWLFGAVSRVLGLKMAPISIPWHRRLETLAVLLWMSLFLFLGLGATITFVYLFLYTQYWWVSLCYLCWYIPDRTICNRGGRRVNWVRRLSIWKHFSNFFPIRLIKTADLDPGHNYIMCYHPHGILCAGAFSTFATEGTGWSRMFPGLTPYLLTLEGLFWMPLYREIFLCSGAVSAIRDSMDHLLGKEGTGRALCLVVGGAPESLDSHPEQIILHLDRRRGFAKMALRHGASLVPMFAFGENEIYEQLANPAGSTLRRVQDTVLSTVGLPLALFMGRGVFQYSLGIVPYRKPIYLVVGAPIHVDPVSKPTMDQIMAVHARYRQALLDLYNTHKHTYARDPTLEIKFV